VSDSQRCATCQFWQRQGQQTAHAQRDPSCPADQGTYFAAPSVVTPAASFAVGLFPRTHQDRWCGGWKPAGTGGPHGGEVVEIRRAAA
jgi:hypothetical protein